MKSMWTLFLILGCVYLRDVNAAIKQDLSKFSPAVRKSMEEAKNLTRIINEAMRTNDKNERPNAGGPPVMVDMMFKVVSIGEIKEANMEYSMDIFFRQWWYDPRFAHNQSKPFTMAGDATKLFWTPDTMFWNVKKSTYHFVTRENMRIMIHPDGKIYFSTRISFTASCEMDLRLYPMDTQRCPLVIESYAHTRADIDYRWKKGSSKGIEVVSKSIAQFELVDTETFTKKQTNSAGSFASMKAVFTLRRRMDFYITSTYVPACVLVFLSWCCFWINRSAVPARITLAITTILTTILLHSSINSSMPKVSYVKAIDYFLLTSFGFIFASLLEFILVLNTRPHFRKERPVVKEKGFKDVELQPILNLKDVPHDALITIMDEAERKNGNSQGDKAQTNLLRRAAAYNAENPGPARQPVTVNNTPKPLPPHLDVHWIDRVARVLFPLCYFSFIGAYFIYYASVLDYPLKIM